MVKSYAYAELVVDRRACQRCKGLRNPSQVDCGRFDSDEVGPWSRWQGNLDAQLMVVGQDWGGIPYFRQFEGWDGPGNPTNDNLAELLKTISITISPPKPGKGQDALFFTNAVLCLKKQGLQDKTEGAWFHQCAPFLRRQIEIVSPKVVVGLGAEPFKSILRSFGLRLGRFRDAVDDQDGTRLPNGSRAFAVYHCGARGVNMNRPYPDQVEDWKRVGRFLATKERL